jgi:hypothetical protein
MVALPAQNVIPSGLSAPGKRKKGFVGVTADGMVGEIRIVLKAGVYTSVFNSEPCFS